MQRKMPESKSTEALAERLCSTGGALKSWMLLTLRMFLIVSERTKSVIPPITIRMAASRKIAFANLSFRKRSKYSKQTMFSRKITAEKMSALITRPVIIVFCQNIDF